MMKRILFVQIWKGIEFKRFDRGSNFLQLRSKLALTGATSSIDRDQFRFA
jgi:hypothetical protein